MRSLLALFTHNWKLKLAAFGLAVLLWTTVTADQIAVRWLEVPVEVELRDDEYRLLQGPTPNQVQVRISGPRREFWDLGINRPSLRLVLAAAQEGTQSYPLDPQQVQIPRRVARGLTPVEVSPARVTLAFVRVADATVPVRLAMGDPLPDEYAFIDTPRVEPAMVLIRGPRERVAAVGAVQTRPVDFSREDGAFQRSVRIDTAGLAGLELSTREVTVTGRAERAVQLVITDVPIQSPSGVVVVPGAVDVQVWGAESVVRGLGSGSLRVVVPPETIGGEVGSDGRTVPLRIEGLPVGVRATAEPRVVRLLPAPEPPPIPEIRTLPGTQPPAPAPPDTTAAEPPDPDAR